MINSAHHHKDIWGCEDMTQYVTSTADGCKWSALYYGLHKRCSITFAHLCEILKDCCSVISLYVGRVAQLD